MMFQPSPPSGCHVLFRCSPCAIPALLDAPQERPGGELGFYLMSKPGLVLLLGGRWFIPRVCGVGR